MLLTIIDIPAGVTETPTTLVWAKYFLAQLYDHAGERERALAIVDQAIQHTPTFVDLYTCKAKIYKVARFA